jgi:hypothetical protein
MFLVLKAAALTCHNSQKWLVVSLLGGILNQSCRKRRAKTPATTHQLNSIKQRGVSFYNF